LALSLLHNRTLTAPTAIRISDAVRRNIEPVIPRNRDGTPYFREGYQNFLSPGR